MEYIFDNIAENYRSIHNKNLSITGFSSNHFAENKVKILADELNLADKTQCIRILDIGCGDGMLEEYIDKHIPNCEVLGVDVSKESIRIAGSKNISACVFKEYNGLDIPCKDNSFQVAILSTVLHHIQKKCHGRLVSEAYRVLEKDGILIIFEHNPFNPFTQYIVKTCPFDRDVNLLTHAYLKKLLLAGGFSVNKVNFMSFFPDILNLIRHEHLLRKIPLGGQYYITALKS